VGAAGGGSRSFAKESHPAEGAGNSFRVPGAQLSPPPTLLARAKGPTAGGGETSDKQLERGGAKIYRVYFASRSGDQHNSTRTRGHFHRGRDSGKLGWGPTVQGGPTTRGPGGGEGKDFVPTCFDPSFHSRKREYTIESSVLVLCRSLVMEANAGWRYDRQRTNRGASVRVGVSGPGGTGAEGGALGARDVAPPGAEVGGAGHREEEVAQPVQEPGGWDRRVRVGRNHSCGLL